MRGVMLVVRNNWK